MAPTALLPLAAGGVISAGARVKLYVNGRLAAEGETNNAMFRHGVEPFEVGSDSISPVNAAYKGKGDFALTGRIDKIQFDVSPVKLGAADQENLKKAQAPVRVAE